MPEKPLTIATYAAGASLAAITLVYVFGPTFLLDGDSHTASNRKGVVGLANPANDCFINSVLQALAGLPDLRLYLIREVHRRKLDGAEVYNVTADDIAAYERKLEKTIEPGRLDGLRRGIVTVALKQILDKLNERPIYKKTITAQEFVSALETAFRTRISRQQQDAQEFLQIVTERLCDEYHAGKSARAKARARLHAPLAGDGEALAVSQQEKEAAAEEEGFPFEGKLEAQVECAVCHFRPKPSVSTFVTLTLNVPQTSSTSLNSCFDGMLKIEHIDDYKCDFCRLEHAIDHKKRELSLARDGDKIQQLEADIAKLGTALREDPEVPPKDVELPNSRLAPNRRIARHSRISVFPKVLAIHLSRSLYSAATLSTKNMAKVSFPETLPLGGILEQHRYRLLGVVTHKGGHNSGHYESFRRQVIPEPFSTPHSFGADGPYSRQGSPNPSATQSPHMSARTGADSARRSSQLVSDTPSISSATITLSASPSSASSQSSLSLSTQKRSQQRPAGQGFIDELPPSPPPPPPSLEVSKPAKTPLTLAKRKKRRDNRWWRISDERIKESRTSEVLSMQKDVYLLFYELDRRTDDA